MSTKKILAIVLSSLILIGLIAGGIFYMNSQSEARKITSDEAETFLNETFDNMTNLQRAKVTPFIAQNNKITVNNITYGNEKDIIVDCSIETIDFYNTVSPHYNHFLSATNEKRNSSTGKTATEFKLFFERDILNYLKTAPVITNNCTITIYDTHNGLEVYATDDVLNAVFGGIKYVENDILSSNTYIDENGIEQPLSSPNVIEGFIESLALRYNATKPDTSNFIGRAWNSFKNDFHKNFIEYDRWKTIFQGLLVTLELTFFALIIGIVLGFLVAFIRCTYLKNTKRGPLLKFFNAICQIYLTVIRGTPAVVQIMIIYFVIFMHPCE